MTLMKHFMNSHEISPKTRQTHELSFEKSSKMAWVPDDNRPRASAPSETVRRARVAQQAHSRFVDHRGAREQLLLSLFTPLDTRAVTSRKVQRSPFPFPSLAVVSSRCAAACDRSLGRPPTAMAMDGHRRHRPSCCGKMLTTTTSA